MQASERIDGGGVSGGGYRATRFKRMCWPAGRQQTGRRIASQPIEELVDGHVEGQVRSRATNKLLLSAELQGGYVSRSNLLYAVLKAAGETRICGYKACTGAWSRES